MNIDKQKIALLISCMCAGSAFSAGFSMPHAGHVKTCPIYMDLEKTGKVVIAKPEADKGQTTDAERKAGKTLVLNTQAGAPGTTGGAAKTAPTSLPGQNSAPSAP